MTSFMLSETFMKEKRSFFDLSLCLYAHVQLISTWISTWIESIVLGPSATPPSFPSMPILSLQSPSLVHRGKIQTSKPSPSTGRPSLPRGYFKHMISLGRSGRGPLWERASLGEASDAGSPSGRRIAKEASRTRKPLQVNAA